MNVRRWPVSCNEFAMLMYQAYQAHTDLLWPMRNWARLSAPMLQEPPATRKMAAACRLIELAEVTHTRPAWRIHSVEVAGEAVTVHEEVVHRTPFGTLLHFRKDTTAVQPRVLLAAPLSGHFATLLREIGRAHV